MFDDRFAECLTNLSVFNSFVDTALGNTNCQGADHRTSEVQCLHSIDEAFAFFAYEMVSRDMNVLEDNFRRVGETDAHLVFFSANGNAFAVTFYDESGDAFYALRFIGYSEYGVNGSNAAVGDEAFRAVDDIFVANFFSCRFAVGSIRTSVRFC